MAFRPSDLVRTGSVQSISRRSDLQARRLLTGSGAPSRPALPVGRLLELEVRCVSGAVGEMEVHLPTSTAPRERGSSPAHRASLPLGHLGAVSSQALLRFLA